MPVKYGFLKYGSPLVAAAPLLVGLNALPTPAYACNGFPDDPPHCANNNGQVITGFENFRTDNLQGIPGSTTVPGDTPSSYEEFEETPSFSTTNTSVQGGSPFRAPNFEGQPQFEGQPGQSPGTGNPYNTYIVGDPGYAGGSEVSITIDPVSGLMQVGTIDGKFPGGFQEMIDNVDDDEGAGSSSDRCQLNISACQLQAQDFWNSVEGAVDPTHAGRILDAATTDPGNSGGPGVGPYKFTVYGPGSEIDNGEGPDNIGDALVSSLRREFGKTAEIRGDRFSNDDDDTVYGVYSDSVIHNDDDTDPSRGGGIEGDGFDSTDDDDDAIYSSVDLAPNDDDTNNDDDNVGGLYSSVNATIINEDEDADPTTGGGIGGSGTINTDDSESSAPSETNGTPDVATAFAARMARSLQKQRDRAANETDPVRKRQLEENIKRLEESFQGFGTQAVRVGLHNQDVQTTPLPSRN